MTTPPLTAQERALRSVFRTEGGWVFDPRDSGGETNMGITWATLRQAISRGIVPPATTIRDLTKPQAAAIYRALFWDDTRCGLLPGAVGLVVFDHAVHSGSGAAVRLLQEVVGAPIDGVIGPRTVTAVAGPFATDPEQLLTDLIDARFEAQQELIARRPKDARFRRGWRRRLFRLATEAGRLLEVA